jgi:N4-gp56 family major capsid protein
MSGQVWSTSALGGYMWSPNLSRKLRTALQPMVRFRQFCDAKEAFGLGIGATFNWNIYSDVQQPGSTLVENQVMPETNFVITQNSLTITEYGNSVPFTKKLDDLSEQPVTEIIHKVLKNDARKVLDLAAYNQFNASPYRIWGTSTSTIVVNTNGTVSGTSSGPLTNTLVKVIADYMAEQNVPTFDGVNYMAIFRPTPLRSFKNNLEGINQYTPEGWHVIMNGEKGRYEGIRFVEQTNIPLATNAVGATFANTDRGFFFGSDTVVEAFAIPEEIRGKIPTDYGRSRGIAWYAELGFGIAHTEVPGSRIFVWDSQA